MAITQFQIDNSELFVLLDTGELLRKNLKTDDKWQEVALPVEYIPKEEQGPRISREEITFKSIEPSE